MVFYANARASDGAGTEAETAVDLEQLGEEIAELAAHLHAATYRLLVCLREFDAREGWTGGFRNCAHWLSWRTGIALGTAREKVRVARALHDLPLLSDAMRRGELSFAKVRAATRVATRENEDRLLELARHATASQVERVVRAWRRVDRAAEQAEERERHFSRELSLYVDDDGMYVLRGRLDPEVGATLERALAAAVEALYGRTKSSDEGGRSATADTGAENGHDAIDQSTIEQCRADAIGLIAECALRGGINPDAPQDGEETTGKRVGRADRFQVVVHIDAGALRECSETGQSVLVGGVRVSAETSRRIACDSSRVEMTHSSDGSVLDVGRRTRVVPAAIRRALDVRDGGCRFPGCGLRHCDAHHVRHWADGGETRIDNLVLICRRHHRLVHEEGWRILAGPDGELRFHRPDGRLLVTAPSLPLIAEDPVAVLMAVHEQAGLAISAESSERLRSGQRLDVDFTIFTVRGP